MREKLIELHRVMCKSLHCNYDEFQCAMTIDTLITAENLIANGVTIPVRCKDCKHTRNKNSREQAMYNENVCICTKEDIWGITKDEPVWDDGFCSHGERRTDDG